MKKNINESVTLFKFGHAETIETNKTNAVGNEEFLQAVFSQNQDKALPIVVSFMGNPSTASRNKWFGQPWLEDKVSIAISPNANNYFSLAVFQPDESGKYRRKKAQFKALYAVMLDDVGSKVPLDRLTLAPSWLLETSPGNFQVGYLLAQPITDSKTANQLMNAIINAGLCDPGANGPTARLARLPIGINGKHEPLFNCQMKTWSPDLRYSMHELIEGLQLEIVEKKPSKKEGSHSSQAESVDTDLVWVPRPTENVVVTSLRQHNLYKAPLGGGKHDLSCPWKEEHTDNIDSGTAYFEPDENWPIGGFKCLHGHCVDRHIRDLLRILDIDIMAARMKSTIRVLSGEIHRVVDAAELELARSKQYYQRGGLIVTVFNDPCTHQARIQEVSLPALVRALSGIVIWERYDARTKGLARIDPPARHAAVLFDASNYLHLPVLNGLARQPCLRADGSMMSIAGYDSITGMFGVFDPGIFSVSEKPSRTEAESAVALLHELLGEFSFATDADRSAALAAILTAAIRPSLPHAPMFHVHAHTAGSGKSYLCELITAFATPQRGTPTTFPADDEECRKLLLAELLRGPAVIEFDNLNGDLLAYKSLCTALTSEFMNGRILGVSKIATVNTRALFLSSGNNVGPVKDMARRCITIRLNPEIEIPAARTFTRPNLIRELLRERERYVSAALTIICAWIAAGRPRTECKSLASYGEWSDLCREPLLWLGCNDPASSVFEALAEDPDRETLARLLFARQSAFGRTPTMVREAVKRAEQPHGEGNELREALYDIAVEKDGINSRKLGWWIKRHTGQIVDGLRFVRCSGNGPVEKWRVELVSSVSLLFSPPNEKSVSGESLSAK